MSTEAEAAAAALLAAIRLAQGMNAEMVLQLSKVEARAKELIELGAEQPEPVPPEPVPPVGGADEYPPITGKKLVAANPAEFRAVYAGWKPGDHIVLADRYDGPLGALDRKSPGGWIVIRAETNQGVRVTDVNISGGGHWLWGLTGSAFGLSGQGNVQRRCLWGGNRSGYISEITGNANRWEYCSFLNSEGGLRLQNGTKNSSWLWCYWKGINGQANASEALILNEGYKQTLFAGGFVVEDCLFEDCNLGGDENETISSKCSNNTFRRVVLKNTRDLSLRFGNNCLVEGVRIDRGEVRARGRNHMLLGVWGKINLPSGDWDPAGTVPPRTCFPASLEAMIKGGVGPIGVGTDKRTVRARGARIERHAGGIENLQGGADEWKVEAASSERLVLAPTYTAEDVGVLAHL